MEKLMEINNNSNKYELYTNWTYEGDKLNIFVYKKVLNKLVSLSSEELSNVDNFIINIKKELFSNRYKNVGSTIHDGKKFQIVYDTLTSNSSFYEVVDDEIVKPSLPDYKYLNNKFNRVRTYQESTNDKNNKRNSKNDFRNTFKKIIVMELIIGTATITSFVFNYGKDVYNNYKLSSNKDYINSENANSIIEEYDAKDENSDVQEVTNNENYVIQEANDNENAALQEVIDNKTFNQDFTEGVVYPSDINSYALDILKSLAQNGNLNVDEKNFLISHSYKLIENNEDRINVELTKKSLSTMSISYPEANKYGNSVNAEHSICSDGHSNINIYNSRGFDDKNEEYCSALNHEFIHVLGRYGAQYEGICEELNQEYLNFEDETTYSTLRYHDNMLANLIGVDPILDEQFGKSKDSISKSLQDLGMTEDEITKFMYNINAEYSTYFAINSAIRDDDKALYYEEVNNINLIEENIKSYYTKLYDAKNIDYNDDEYMQYYQKFCNFFKEEDYYNGSIYQLPVVGVLSDNFSYGTENQELYFHQYFKTRMNGIKYDEESVSINRSLGEQR